MTERYGLQFVGRAQAQQAAVREPQSVLVPDIPRSIRWDLARDALVVGDNLEVLKLLRPAYFERVSAIYIDPPYNTGNDFVYRDRFEESSAAYLQRSGQTDAHGQRLVANPETSGRYHSAWLSMMLPRLQAAHALLREDGVLFVSIDDNEIHHLRMLLDEVFGEENFIAQITVISNRGGRDYMKIAVTHEYLLCFGKSADSSIAELPKQGPAPPHHDERGPYELRELRNRNPRFGPHNRPNLFYPVHVVADPEPGSKTELGVSLQATEQHTVVVEPRNSTGAPSVWRWGRPKLEAALGKDAAHSEVVARRRRDGGYNIYEKHRKSTTKARSVWDDVALRSERGTQQLRETLGSAVFDHPKPVELVKRCLRLCLPPDGLVLDFFAGSGTLAQAVMELDDEDDGARRYILVQLDEDTPSQSPARAAGLQTVDAIARARVEGLLASRPERGLRVVRAAETKPEPEPKTEAEPDPWNLALAYGLGLDVRLDPIAPHTFVADDGQRRHVFALAKPLDRTAAEALDLPSGTAVTVREDAVDDEVLINLSARYQLRTW